MSLRTVNSDSRSKTLPEEHLLLHENISKNGSTLPTKSTLNSKGKLIMRVLIAYIQIFLKCLEKVQIH